MAYGLTVSRIEDPYTVTFTATGLTGGISYKFWIYSGSKWWIKDTFTCASGKTRYTPTDDISVSDNNDHDTCLTGVGVTDPSTQQHLADYTLKATYFVSLYKYVDNVYDSRTQTFSVVSKSLSDTDVKSNIPSDWASTDIELKTPYYGSVTGASRNRSDSGFDITSTSVSINIAYRTKAVVYYASITYYPNGGTGTSHVSSNSSEGSSDVSFIAPTAEIAKFSREGYDLTQWKDNAEEQIVNVGASFTKTGGTTVKTYSMYAQWTLKTYPITYNANGHGTAPSTEYKTYGKDYYIHAYISDVPAAEQKTVYDWKPSAYSSSETIIAGTKKSCTKTTEYYWHQTNWLTGSSSGTSHTAGSKYTANQALDLYAKWTYADQSSYVNNINYSATKTPSQVNLNTVTFHKNGGYADQEKHTYEQTTYTFNNTWYYIYNSQTVPIQEATPIPENNYPAYPYFTSSTSQITSVICPTSTTMTHPEGRTLLGFSNSASSTTIVYSPGQTIYNINRNIDLYAVWEETLKKPTIISTTANSTGCTSTQLSIKVKISGLTTGYWNCHLVDPTNTSTILANAVDDYEKSYSTTESSFVFTNLSANTKYKMVVSNYSTSKSYSSTYSTADTSGNFRTRLTAWTWGQTQVEGTWVNNDTTGMDFKNIKYAADQSNSWLKYISYVKSLNGSSENVDAATANILAAKMMNQLVFKVLNATTFCGHTKDTNEFKTGESVLALYFQTLKTEANSLNAARVIKVDTST